MTYRTLFTVALVATSLALGACGRKSDLDTPRQAALDRQQEARDAGEPVPDGPRPPVEDRRFILDSLID